MKKLLLSAAVLLAGCAGGERVTLESPNGDRIQLAVDIADTAEKQTLGLMGRTALPADYGMLFVFPDEFTRTFWMKNTLIPLDILFFDADGRFVSAKSMTPCTEDPCPLYSSQTPAKYALETQTGFTDARGIGSGWTMEYKQ